MGALVAPASPQPPIPCTVYCADWFSEATVNVAVVVVVTVCVTTELPMVWLITQVLAGPPVLAGVQDTVSSRAAGLSTATPLMLGASGMGQVGVTGALGGLTSPQVVVAETVYDGGGVPYTASSR